jgi:hypothetical protein
MLFKYVMRSFIQKRLTTSAGVFTDRYALDRYDGINEGIMGVQDNLIIFETLSRLKPQASLTFGSTTKGISGNIS